MSAAQIVPALTVKAFLAALRQTPDPLYPWTLDGGSMRRCVERKGETWAECPIVAVAHAEDKRLNDGFGPWGVNDWEDAADYLGLPRRMASYLVTATDNDSTLINAMSDWDPIKPKLLGLRRALLRAVGLQEQGEVAS